MHFLALTDVSSKPIPSAVSKMRLPWVEVFGLMMPWSIKVSLAMALPPNSGAK